MLENCLSGSEGGGAFALPTPIIALRSVERSLEVMRKNHHCGPAAATRWRKVG